MTEDQERHPRDQESGGDEHEELSGDELAGAEPEGGDEAQDPEGEAVQSDRGE